jgi:hypothetical protein
MSEDWKEVTPELITQLIEENMKEVDVAIMSIDDDELRARAAYIRPIIYARVRAIAEQKSQELLAQLHRSNGSLN